MFSIVRGECLRRNRGIKYCTVNTVTKKLNKLMNGPLWINKEILLALEEKRILTKLKLKSMLRENKKARKLNTNI